MRDPRLETLARQLIRYSCALKPGERVLIENFRRRAGGGDGADP